jgi:hypothetical protein
MTCIKRWRYPGKDQEYRIELMDVHIRANDQVLTYLWAVKDLLSSAGI